MEFNDELFDLINNALDSSKIDCVLYKLNNGTVRLRDIESNKVYRDSNNLILSNKALIKEIDGFLVTDNDGCYPRHSIEQTRHLKRLIKDYLEV